MTSATTDPSSHITTADQLANRRNMATAISQSSTLQQGLVQGAPQSRSTDITTSNPVINSSSSAVTAQSGDQQWLDNSSISGWDKQPGSQQSTPRLDHANNPATTQFSGWGSQPFPSSYASDSQTGGSSAWPNPNNNNNNLSLGSAWGSQSPNINRQQPAATTSSDWGMPTNTASTSQWGMSTSSANSGEQDSWGTAQRLPNAGTESWGQSAASSQQNTPSSANAQMSQWGQPVPHTSASTTAWQTSNNGNASNQPPSNPSMGTPNTSASTATQQWGANSSAGQPSTLSPPSATSSTISGLASPQPESSATPTSWAGAAAKGLPKTIPKPPEPVDPTKLAMEQCINNPEGWGRPVRQDTAWGTPPEKNKQDESNQWHSTQNNGTAIWESSKTTGGHVQPADKSTWNQKVAGNNDPNVWNGEGSKGKDNALWDDLPSSKESESPDQPSSWNTQGPQSRTVSQSSAGDGNTDSAGWSSSGTVPGPAGVSRSSPPNSINRQPTTPMGGDGGWGAQNGTAGDPRKLTRWDSTPGPMRMSSVSETDGRVIDHNNPGASDAFQRGRLISSDQGHVTPTIAGGVVAPPASTASHFSSAAADAPAAARALLKDGRGGSNYWDSGQGRQGGGAPSNWNSKPSVSWTGDSNTGAGGWGPSQPGPAGQHGGWGDAPSNNQWQGGSNRKPSYGWDDNQSNGPDFGRDRRLKSDSGQIGDDDCGDWNESNSVWSSAGGFKSQMRKHSTIPENHVPMHMQNNRMGGGGSGHYGGGGPAGMMNSGVGGNGIIGTKQQMIQYLMSLKYTKEEAHSALINNNMNMDAALADLSKNAGMQQQRPGDFGGMPMPGGPMGDAAFNPNIPPPNIATNALNTPYNTNAQHNQSAVQGSSRINKPNQQQRGPMSGRNNAPNTLTHQQQTSLVRQLELAVQSNAIHPYILSLPLIEPNIRFLHQLLALHQSYQNNLDTLNQMQRRHGMSSLQAETASRNVSSLGAQMKNLQAPYIKQAHEMNKSQYVGGGNSGGVRGSSLADNLSGLSLTNNLLPNNAGGSSITSSSSQSRLGIWTDKAPGSARQGGVFGDSNPWSSSGSSAWSNMGSAGQYLDNPNESHSLNPNGGHANPAQSYDIPEFVPGVPWQGASSQKVEDDPNITPGSVARSISVSTAASLNPSGRNSTDLGWGNGSKNTWSTQNLSSPAGDMWKTGNTRPPPGFGKNMNRSMSMPHGPSEKTSAFSPVGSNWDNQQSQLSSASVPWLLLRTIPPQVDGNLLKTLCSQHGPLQSFFVNTNNGQALVRYNSKEESMKAQKSLNSCSLGDTTIIAEFIDEGEVQKIVEQCQRQSALGRSHSVSAAPGSGMWTSSNSGSTSNLWGGPGMGTGSASTWSALPNSSFLPPVDIASNNFNM